MDLFSPWPGARFTLFIVGIQGWGVCGGFPKVRESSRGPYDKDSSIGGSILKSPYLGKLPYMVTDLSLGSSSDSKFSLQGKGGW